MARPPSENPRSAMTLIRQTPAEKAKWQAAADALGVTVADLVRASVDQYLKSKRKARKK